MKNNFINKEDSLPPLQELLTIIIPTKNRPYLLNRSLNYYAKSKFLIMIIIIDSSNDILSNKTKVVCDSYNNKLNLEYFHVGVDTEVSDKHYIAADMVDTPYLLSVGDDDFPLKSTMRDLLIRLEDDKSIVAAFGQRIAITQIGSKTSGFKHVKSYPNYGGISITNESAIDRIRRLPIPIWQQYPNSIFRTNVYKKAYQMVRKLEHTQYAEFFTLSFILAHGKWVKYNMLFTVCHQESKFCKFKDRYLFPSYIGSGGSVLDGISQDSWSRVVSLLCNMTACEFVNDTSKKMEDMSLEIRHIYYSKLVNYIEYSSILSNNLIDNDSFLLRNINNLVIKIGRMYWKTVLYDRSGGVYEFIKFLFDLSREIINGRLIKLILKSTTSTNVKGLLISIKRTGSLDYESEILLHTSSRYHKEYKIIFDIWTNDPCPQRLKEDLHNKE